MYLYLVFNTVLFGRLKYLGTFLFPDDHGKLVASMILSHTDFFMCYQDYAHVIHDMGLKFLSWISFWVCAMQWKIVQFL